MSDPRPQEIIWKSRKGDVHIRSFCTPEEIRSYTFSDEFGTHAQFRSLYTKRESLEKDAVLEDANVVLAVTDDKHIIGFGVVAYPGKEERWVKVGERVVIELKAIEVSRGWRSLGIAKGLVRMMMAHPLMEEKIIYLVGYSWTWDLDGTKKSALEYRNLLISLMEPYGFKEFQSNEPNITLRPENVLLARIGENVPREVQNRFKWVRFGVYQQ